MASTTSSPSRLRQREQVCGAAVPPPPPPFGRRRPRHRPRPGCSSLCSMTCRTALSAAHTCKPNQTSNNQPSKHQPSIHPASQPASSPISSASVWPTSVGRLVKTFLLFSVPSARTSSTAWYAVKGRPTSLGCSSRPCTACVPHGTRRFAHMCVDVCVREVGGPGGGGGEPQLTSRRGGGVPGAPRQPPPLPTTSKGTPRAAHVCMGVPGCCQPIVQPATRAAATLPCLPARTRPVPPRAGTAPALRR